MTKQSWIIALLLFILAFALRFNHFENTAPFDWDQNRDYAEVSKIASGKFVTLGPIAKGSGGFYLGSLYYYVLYPAYYLMSGSLSALPLTSLTLDALVVGLLYLLLYKIMGRKKALIISLLWGLSWFVIGMSRISWNVSLVPLWSLATMYSLTELLNTKNKIYLYLLGFLIGLAVHIHVAAIAVIPILLVLFYAKIRFTILDCVKIGFFATIPVIPLIIHDLNHGFQNAHLLRDQIGYQTVVKTPLIPMIQMTLIKLGKIVSGLFFSKFADNFLFGLLIITLSLKSFFLDKRNYMKVASASILIATALIIAFHDYGFPEYYFAPAYISIVVLVVTYLFDLGSYFGKLGTIALVLAFIVVGFINIRSYTVEPTGFSLKVKEDIVESLKEFDGPIDMSYNFDPGRDGGLRYLVKLKGIDIDPKAKQRILLTDKLNVPLYIDGELARDVEQIGNIKSALYIVQ